MKFCKECQSVMTKNTSTTGTIVFTCACQITIDGEAEDTLMHEESLDGSATNQIHNILIDNAPFDNAGHIVLKDCPQCGLNFMTLVCIGVNQTTIYTCSCGLQVTHTDYVNMVKK